MRSKMSAIGTSDSVFHDGNPSTGELGTIVTADWLNAVQASTMDLQDELLNVLAAASIANDSAVKTQILAAIKYLSSLATFATDTGTANTYVATLAPALTAYANGVKIRLKILNANTGTSTLNVNALGAKTIYGGAHAVLQGGELVANGYAEFEYSSTLGGFVLLFCTGAPEQTQAGTKANHASTMAQVQSQAANFIADTGTANTYVATLVPALAAYADGIKIRLKIANANTASSTLNVNGLGAKTIYGAAHVVLQAGELIANGYAEFEYSSTLAGFVLLFCTGAPEQIASGAQSQHAATLAQVQSQAANFITDTGTANTYVATLVPAATSYYDGMKIRLKIINTNTGASTLNVNGLGAKSIYGAAHSALQAGELLATGYAELEYSASLGGFVLLFCTGAPEQLAAAVKSLHALTLGQFLGGATSSSYIKIPFIDIADGVTKRNLIIQWGYTTVIPTGSVGATTTFPIAFPTICAQVVTSYGNATTPAVSYPSNLISQSTTGFTVTQQSTGHQQFTYIAIGF